MKPSAEALQAIETAIQIEKDGLAFYPPIFPTGDEIKGTEIPERELSALQRGIEAEKDSIAFYSQERDKTDDPDGQAMYAYLVEQEEGHRTILQGEYDYLNRTGFWFDIQEFDLEAAG